METYAQTYFFDNFSVAEGLEQSKVYSIVQDSLHYVWLGTKGGVSRFDGLHFNNYTIENGIAPGGVRTLLIDKKHRIWMGHEGGGISRYDGKNFETIVFPDSLIRSNITSMALDKSGWLWVTTELNGALAIKNPHASVEEIKYEHFLKGKKLSDQIFNCMVASDSSIYMLTNIGIRKFNTREENFEAYTPDGMFNFFSTTVMFEDSRKNLWFGTYNGGLYKLNYTDGKFIFFDTHNGLAANWISTLTEDRKGNIWVGHWSQDKAKAGITRIDTLGNLQIFNTTNGLHDNQIWDIMEDVEGNILVGTTEHGLDIFKGEQFVNYSKTDGLINNLVWAITEDSYGKIWFGTNEGLTVYDKNSTTQKFTHYYQSKDFISNQVRVLHADRNHNIWIGTADQGVILYNETQKRFNALAQINSFLPYQNISREVTALEIDLNYHLWIGTFEGLVEWDLEKNSYITTHTQGSGLAGNDISSLFLDSKNRLWIGSRSKGLTCLHNGNFQFIEGLRNITPTCLAEDHNGNLWVGTETKGVYLISNDSLKQYSQDDGLLANLINLLAVDAENNIYVGTNRGLNKIDQLRKRILTFTYRNGFVGIETKTNASFTDTEGNIWFGTVNGAMRCNPSLEKKNVKSPEVLVERLMVNGSDQELIPGLKLPSYKSDLLFFYSSMSITNPEQLMYQIQLIGLHDSWQEMKGQKYSLYNKLPPGRYTFKVRVCNEYGIWCDVPAEYSFRILAPFYKRGFFIVSVGLILVIGIATYIRIRERNLVVEKKVLEGKVLERTQALSEVNDELSMKNKDILDSINYARRIQFAILPPEIPFPDTFILFKPKDIVSGDFYWMNTAGDKEFLIAVDCTGHGVPGAFMSFIGFTSLNKIIIEQGITQPAAILNQLNEEVAKSLHQKGESIVNDGMDIALVSYSPGTKILEYAGAFNPLILVRKGELIETKANRFAIGRSTGQVNEFTNHTLEIQSGDSIYIFSDGYADQFGGPDEKKFKISSLKELLISISVDAIPRQQEVLDYTFEAWKNGQEQIDDVLLMGRRFS